MFKRLHTGEDPPDPFLSNINTTPLVDVMLVLLIIFLITIPVVTSSIPVSLPQERIEVREAKPANIIISVDRDGHIFWYETRIDSLKLLARKLGTVAQQQPQPEIQLRADRDARYEGVGRVLLACQRAGIAKVAFITEPPPLGG